MAAPAALDRVAFDRISRRHGIKIVPVMNCSVEECSLAVGKAVGYESIMSASRMSSAVVIFLDSIEKVTSVVQSGVVIKDTFTPVIPLVQPARKVTLSNVPPFIKDDILLAELSRHGKVVSQMKKVPLGCKSPLLKHVVCFRRQVHMILKSEIDELSVAFKFKIDGFDYIVFVSSETMKCFGCGREGHIRRACPEKTDAANVVTAEDGGGGVVEEQVQDNVMDGEKTKENESEQVNDMEIEGADGEVPVECSHVVEAAEAVLEGGAVDSESVNEEDIFKTPTIKRKRAKTKMERASIFSDGDVKHDDSDHSTVDDSDEATDSKNRGKQCEYSFVKIRAFLQKTKNMKNVHVVDFFPDRRLFIESVGTLMRGDGTEQFTVQEIYRLKKFVAKLRQELQMENGFETT